MAYTPGTLSILAGALHTRRRIWEYETADAMTVVRAADYFKDAKYRGMKVGDFIYVLTTVAGVPSTAYLSVVMAVDDDGADIADGTEITLTNT